MLLKLDNIIVSVSFVNFDKSEFVGEYPFMCERDIDIF